MPVLLPAACLPAAAVFLNSLPLATLIFNRRDYVRLRSRIVLFQTVLGWYASRRRRLSRLGNRGLY